MKTFRRDLCEASSGTTAHQVDRENGVIKRVKVLGKSSPNRHGLSNVNSTEYTTAAMEAALSQYEGRQVYVDHPPRSNPGVERSVRDMAGELRNAAVESDGIYADLHYLPGTDDGRRLADIAERMPSRLGLSHNATGAGRVIRGKYVIESIETVRSVDLVTRPATTRGLYESQESGAMAKTLKEVLSDLEIKGARLVKPLLEMDGLDGGDALVPAAPSAAGGDDESAETHLGRAILAIINDSSLDATAKKKKVLAALKLMDDEAVETPAETSSETSGDETTMESLQREVSELRRDKEIRELCESEQFAPTKPQFKALRVLEAADRKEFIADAKKANGKPNAPRSQGAGRNLTESREQPIDAKGFASRILG